jgi:hypothetical protein
MGLGGEGVIFVATMSGKERGVTELAAGVCGVGVLHEQVVYDG